jgi:hypothetical protein
MSTEKKAYVQAVKQEGDTVTITLFLGNDNGPSSSGKSTVVGYEAMKITTSQGIVTVACNAYKPIPKVK